jgi:hypothetical protein
VLDDVFGEDERRRAIGKGKLMADVHVSVVVFPRSR